MVRSRLRNVLGRPCTGQAGSWGCALAGVSAAEQRLAAQALADGAGFADGGLDYAGIAQAGEITGVVEQAAGRRAAREGTAVDVTPDGAAALEHLAASRYDVVVLDRDMPGVHGDDVCRTLAADRSETRVLMLTAPNRPIGASPNQ